MSTKTKTTNRPFGGRDKFGYMMGDFGCNMTFQLVTSWLMKFACDGCGLDYAYFAILIIVAKIFDAINDPIIGALVDSRKPGKHGKYKPWIFWGAIAIAFTTTLLFVDVTSFPTAGKFAYILIMYMLWSIAYTCANVPYGSLNASLTDDPGQRASLSSLRSIGAGFAMLPILILVPMIGLNDEGGVQTFMTGRFVWIALACGVVGIGGFLLTLFLTKERTEVLAVRRQKVNYLKTLKNFFKNRAVVAVSLASLVQIVFIMSYTLTIPYVYPYYFMADKSMLSMANILTMIPMMIVIPFMGKLSVKFGKKEISSWPNLIGVGAFIIMLIIQLTVGFPRNNTGAWMYTALYMVGMLGGGTFMLATWSMVADCVDYQEVLSGSRDEASVYATYSFARKVAQGVGAGLVALLFGAVGCATLEGTGSDPIQNQHLYEHNTQLSVANGIINVAIILPLVGFALAFIILLFMYNLNKKKVIENTNYLRAMRGEAADADLTPTKLFYDEQETKVEENPDKK